MLFGRGQWAVFGVESKTLEAFQKSLNDPAYAMTASQLTASAVTKFFNKASVGINPFGQPRMDENVTDPALLSAIANFAEGQITADEFNIANEALLIGYGVEEDYALGNNTFGFWMVFNAYDDLSDPNSKKEAISYVNMERPFKFLVKEEKKAVEDTVKAEAVMSRKQFPVLVDFQHERVYVASSNTEEIMAVCDTLTSLGAKPYAMHWDFKGYDWPKEFLNKVAKGTQFAAEMKQRADDLARFRPDEIEKLEDKQMEKIVSNFFALTELETALWAGLSTPARIRIHKTSDPVGVSSPSVAFTLLDITNDAEVASSSVVFQELVSKFTKKGEEKLVRNDLFTIDINDNVNNQDAGAAMLRGFDLPQFKKEVKTTIKAKGRVEIKDFWYMWLEGIHNAVLQFIDNITTTLELDKTKYGLCPYEPAGEEGETEVNV